MGASSAASRITRSIEELARRRGGVFGLPIALDVITGLVPVIHVFRSL
jgi:hypothetical protein